jgi:predicted porin
LGGSPLVMANRVTVYGGAVKFPVGGFNVEAFYSATNLNDDSDTQVDEDNAAYGFKASYQRGEKWGVNAGWRHIDPQFYAPGYWGRVGIWTNPTDIESAHIGGWFSLSDRTKISFHKEFFRGADVNLGSNLGLGEDDEIRSFRLMVNHKLNDSWSMWVGGEWVNWDLANRFLESGTQVFDGGKPRERWFDLGFKYAFSENAWFSFLYQMSNYDGKGVVGMNPFSGHGDDQAKGHRKVLQLGVKF